jgi:hypothetical protein
MLKNVYLIRFLIQSFLLSVICFLVAFGTHDLLKIEASYGSVYIMIPFVMLVTVMFHSLLIRIFDISPRSFVGKFVVFSGIKMIIYLVIILIYAFIIKKEIVIFIIGFLILYFLFTILEVSAILKFLKKSTN